MPLPKNAITQYTQLYNFIAKTQGHIFLSISFTYNNITIILQSLAILLRVIFAPPRIIIKLVFVNTVKSSAFETLQKKG